MPLATRRTRQKVEDLVQELVQGKKTEDGKRLIGFSISNPKTQVHPYTVRLYKDGEQIVSHKEWELDLSHIERPDPESDIDSSDSSDNGDPICTSLHPNSESESEQVYNGKCEDCRAESPTFLPSSTVRSLTLPSFIDSNHIIDTVFADDDIVRVVQRDLITKKIIQPLGCPHKELKKRQAFEEIKKHPRYNKKTLQDLFPTPIYHVLGGRPFRSINLHYRGLQISSWYYDGFPRVTIAIPIKINGEPDEVYDPTQPRTYHSVSFEPRPQLNTEKLYHLINITFPVTEAQGVTSAPTINIPNELSSDSEDDQTKPPKKPKRKQAQGSTSPKSKPTESIPTVLPVEPGACGGFDQVIVIPKDAFRRALELPTGDGTDNSAPLTDAEWNQGIDKIIPIGQEDEFQKFIDEGKVTFFGEFGERVRKRLQQREGIKKKILAELQKTAEQLSEAAVQEEVAELQAKTSKLNIHETSGRLVLDGTTKTVQGTGANSEENIQLILKNSEPHYKYVFDASTGIWHDNPNYSKEAADEFTRQFNESSYATEKHQKFQKK
ncbi:hypothetical protein M569_09816 [Genlisea aurea]|uniref:Uncharacterized protein n=1 Tax=Genlisea aurea TaxID=192259 RepID=S8DPI2_9LAMI|nr:hypothetical protein M569_09816 [Genlisea aurea]